MPGDRKRREHSSSYPSTDKPPSGRTPSTHSSTDMWNGGQSTQAGWLNAILRDAEEDYDFNQLSVSGTVTLSRTRRRPLTLQAGVLPEAEVGGAQASTHLRRQAQRHLECRQVGASAHSGAVAHRNAGRATHTYIGEVNDNVST